MANVLEKIGICRECLCGECEYDELRREKGETVCMQKLLDDAAEAIERKKGKWIECKNGAGFKCSVCKARVRRADVFSGNHNYCYKCGTKMSPTLMSGTKEET